MAKVEITTTPSGQAPDWVRQAWIGLALPVNLEPQKGLQMGALGGKAQIKDGFRVPAQEALELLETKNPQAAQWWYANLFTMPAYFIFNPEVCKLIEEQEKK